MSQIGRRARPIDWPAITSGTFAYTADLEFPGLLHAKVVRSPHALAHIRAIETARAEAMSGVRAVIVAADYPKDARYIHEGAADRPPLADGMVRFVGQEVAAVAAETLAQAEAAARAIAIDYEILAAPLDMAASLAPGASQLHRRPTGEANVSVKYARRWGDLAGALSAASRTAAGRYSFPAQCHACMEPGVVVADWRPSEARLHLWTSNAAPYYVVAEVAKVLGLEKDQVLCHEVGIGGSFGARTKVCDYEAVAAQLSRKAGRPVRLVLTREEEFATTKSRHGFEVSLRLHGDAQGRFRGLDGEVLVDNGAYNHSGGSVMSAGLKGLGMLYEPDGLAVDARLVDTAKRPGGQFRGYGTTQTAFALECLIDDLALADGHDPVAYRIANANRPNTVTLVGARLGSSRLAECLEAAADSIEWSRPKADGEGVGVASAVHVSGSHVGPGSNRSDGAIDLYADGRVRLRFGGGDAGTGQKTILAQIAAEALGVPLEKVSVLSMESGETPFDMGAWSSRGTHYTGHAARQTALAAAEALKQLAAEHVGPGEVRLEAGFAVGPNGSVALADLVAGAPGGDGQVQTFETSFVDPKAEPSDPATGKGDVSPSYNFAAHAARVRVDRRTGAVRILDYMAAHDVGVALNPTMVEGQIVGGAAMGLGSAMGEEVVLEQGRMVNGAFLNYALPRAADLPAIRPIIVDGADPAGPHGAKAVGETGVNPAAPAIANAIRDAVGIRLFDPPFTPDKVLAALGLKARDFRLWSRPDRWWIAFVRWAYPRGLFAALHALGRRRYRPEAPVPISAVAKPASLQALVEETAKGAAPLGGGSDLHLRRRLGMPVASKLASVAGVSDMAGISRTPDGGWRIGAGATLAELATILADAAPALAEAARSIASPQIRNAATVGGSLLQANRCWFLRSGFDCFKRRGGLAPCYAILGDHRFHHAAIDGHRCQSVTPSDLGTVLAALDATAVLRSTSGERRVPMDRFYTGPGESVLAAGEVLEAVLLPPMEGIATAFEKLRLYEGDFAIASATLAARIEHGVWRSVRICLGAMAPIPWRARKTEAALEGRRVTPAMLREALDAELDGAAHPLARNRWKLDAVGGLAEAAAERLTG